MNGWLRLRLGSAPCGTMKEAGETSYSPSNLVSWGARKNAERPQLNPLGKLASGTVAVMAAAEILLLMLVFLFSDESLLGPHPTFQLKVELRHRDKFVAHVYSKDSSLDTDEETEGR